MKMIIMIIAAVAIIGGAGGYFFFMQPAEAASAEAPKEEHAKKDKKDGHGEGHGDVQFVELSPLVLPIIDPNGASQTISMVIALEVGDAEAAAKVEQYAPRLKDAYLQDMYGALNRYAALKGGQIRLDVIKKRLNMASTKVLGEDVVHDVLLQVVQQRPI